MKKNRQLNSHLSSQSQKSLPAELRFLSFQQQLGLHLQNVQQNKAQQDNHNDIQQDYKQFSTVQRQNLKNAFRYICRLAFKQSSKYANQITVIIDNVCQGKRHDGVDRIKNLLKDAQVISGERYFKEYLSNLEVDDQKIIVEYMRWFLQRKYLRYLRATQQEKGKRKSMKKQLYLRFKNEVMIPYLLGHMQKIEKY